LFAVGLGFELAACAALGPTIEMWKLSAKMLDAKCMAAVATPRVVHPLLYLLLGNYFIQSDLNEVWAAVRSRSVTIPRS
jgi:hypothetical protein